MFVYWVVMKQKKEEIGFEPVNKLTKSIHGTKVAIDLDEEERENNMRNKEKTEGNNGMNNGNMNNNNLKGDFRF